MSKFMKKIPLMLFVFILVFGLMTVTAGAKTKKLKNQSYTSTISVADKNATTVKKGTYTIKTGSKSNGFLKFKAAKTKKYKFTFSNLKTKRYYTCGFVYIMGKGKYGTLDRLPVNTQGGSNTILWVASRNSGSGHKKDRYLASRYASVKLNKGQVVYLFLNIVESNTSIRLTIK